MQETSEEKNLPASDKKLRDAREKAQVSHSKDFVSGFTFLVVVVYLLSSWPTIRDRIFELIHFAAASTSMPFAEAALRTRELGAQVLMGVVLPVAGFTVLTAILGGIIATFGPVFAFDPIIPKFENINPASGLKRLVSIKSIVEFAKNLFKVVVLGAALLLVMGGWLQTLFEIPVCGKDCIGPVFIAMLKMLAIIAALAFIVVGLADLLMQRSLFLREMRMTHSERKRERKDTEGDPVIRAAQRRMRAAAQSGPAKMGVLNSVLVIAADGFTVALRYNAADTPVPTVVAKARGHAAVAMAAQAHRNAISVSDNAPLAKILYEKHAVGEMVRRQYFTEVASILVRLGLI